MIPVKPLLWPSARMTRTRCPAAAGHVPPPHLSSVPSHWTLRTVSLEAFLSSSLSQKAAEIFARLPADGNSSSSKVSGAAGGRDRPPVHHRTHTHTHTRQEVVFWTGADPHRSWDMQTHLRRWTSETHLHICGWCHSGGVRRDIYTRRIPPC